MKKNIETLNDVLFKTLEDLQSGKMEVAKAKAIVDTSTAITKNASLQLQAFKLAKGKIAPPSLLKGTVTYATIASGDTYEQKAEFSKSLGYDSVAEAIGDLGKFEFEAKFKTAFKTA